MRRIGTAAVLSSLWLAACAPNPAVRGPELTPPDVWSVPSVDERAVDGAWWASFDDPQLTTLVGLALEGNQELRVAVARLDRARAEARIAGADLKPEIGVGLSAARRKQSFTGSALGNAVPPTTGTRLDLAVDVSWEADLWGRIRAGTRATMADYRASEADLRGARLSTAARTAKHWFAIAEARQQMELASNSAESFARLADQIRERYEIGVRTALDLRLALSNASAARAEYERRRIELEGLVRRLEVLLGRYPDGTLLDEFPVNALSSTPAPVPAGLPSELLARRPDLVAAQERLIASDQRWAAARRSLYPRLTLSASGGTASDRLEDLLDGNFSIWSLLGGLTQPILQGGRLRAGVERADAVADEALARYTGSVLRAFSEVEFALAGESILEKRGRHLSDTATQLTAAESLAEDRYRNGLGSYLAVLESQTRAFNARSQLLTLQRQRLDNRVDLHLALGGGFEADGNPGVLASAVTRGDAS